MIAMYNAHTIYTTAKMYDINIQDNIFEYGSPGINVFDTNVADISGNDFNEVYPVVQIDTASASNINVHDNNIILSYIDSATLTATAMNNYTSRNPVYAVNGAGMTGDAHASDTPVSKMWMSSSSTVPSWFKVDLATSYSNLNFMRIWNFNWASYTNRGSRNVNVYYSNSGSDPGNPVDNPGNWTALGSAFDLTQAPGASNYGTTNAVLPDDVDLSGITARWISLKINSGWGGGYLGLSEIRFYTTSGGGSPPGKATSPSPANSATGVSITADLSWTAGSGATSHDVYFGTNQTNVTNATTASAEFKGNQAGTTYDTGTMANNVTYYWRIDEKNTDGTTKGDIWNFTTIVAAPGKATSPSPANSATGVSVTADLSWTADAGATSHDVYFGTNQTNVTNATTASAEFKGNQAGATYDTGTMANNVTYYWRIDEKNAGGTTKGDIWNFTTIAAMPTFVAAGAVAYGTGTITPALPSGIAQAIFYCCSLRLPIRPSRFPIRTAGHGLRLPTHRREPEQPQALPLPGLRSSGRGITVPRAIQPHLIQVTISLAGL